VCYRNDTSALSVGAILHSSPGHALSANTAYFNSANGQNGATASLLHGQVDCVLLFSFLQCQSAALHSTAVLSVASRLLYCSPLFSLLLLTKYTDIKTHQCLHILKQQTSGMQKPLPLNQQQLSRSWDVSQRSTAADWNEWLRRLNVDLLKESPSPALRSCSALAQAYTPLARDLFHAAFVSCWHELSEQYQDSLVSAFPPLLR
jgi:phosphatidylinositol kinase/protein kinase (PI-3  family)